MTFGTAACWLTGVVVLEVSGWGWSRSVAVLSLAVGVPLAVAPVVTRIGLAKLAPLLVVSAALLWLGSSRTSPPDPATTVPTTLHRVEVVPVSGVLDTLETRGGALEPVGEGFLVVTGTGKFFDLALDSGGGPARLERLPMAPPAEYEARRAHATRLLFRVIDLVVDTAGPVPIVYLSHQHRDERDCYSIRVSAAEWRLSGRSAGPWRTVFESAPCLPGSGGWDGFETGGRLALLDDGSLLLTLGDHGLIGQDDDLVAAQHATMAYGKIWRIPKDGPAFVVSTGHRNPQGLEVAADGSIWSTEHGPEGGDEINRIEPGANYGWPLVSYGTQYGLSYWPLGDGGADHGRFMEPEHAFLPSVAVSNLIQLRGPEFARWHGDFLVGSLRIEADLYRVRVRGEGVVYVEPMELGVMVRDLAEGPHGRVVAWTGERLYAIRRGRPSPGAEAYGSCAACHGIDLEGTELGPSLRGIVGRDIATRAGFEYSVALRGVPGAWDEERLDAFLERPEAVAPGTSMAFPGLSDEGARAALIGYMQANR